ncbi:PD-(D/E)XK nuclease-like domain-containing protein [Acinetobacter sp. ANC 5383]
MNALVSIHDAHMIEKMSNEEYHSRPEFSSSQLKDLNRSAAHFYVNSISKEAKKEASTAMNFGTLVHTMFLEPEQFEHEFVIAPKFDRRTKAGKDEALAWEQANEGKMLVSEEDVENATRMATNLRTLSTHKAMQDNYGMAEASFFFTDPTYDLKLRIRPDWHIAPCKAFPNGLIIDLKTTDDARAMAFSRTCANFSYDLSASMYREGFQQYYQTEEKPPFIFLVAERNTPFNVKQYNASDLFLSVGDGRYSKAKERLAASLLIDEWNGYTTELEDIFLPSYLTKQALENDFN